MMPLIAQGVGGEGGIAFGFPKMASLMGDALS